MINEMTQALACSKSVCFSYSFLHEEVYASDPHQTKQFNRITSLRSRRHLYVVGLSPINAHRIWGGSLNRKLLLKVPDPLFSRPNIKEKIAVWLCETTPTYLRPKALISAEAKKSPAKDVSNYFNEIH